MPDTIFKRKDLPEIYLTRPVGHYTKMSDYGPESEIGIELELEGFGAHEIHKSLVSLENGRFWTVHDDLSLRGDSTELVLKRPVTRQVFLEVCMPVLAEAFADSNFEPALSNRCSFHVHLNFSCNTLYSLMKFITVYALLEPYFFETVGKNRKGNHFCLALSEAELFVEQFIKGFRNQVFFELLNEENRYMALNLGALMKFGSVEIRLHEGEYRVHRIISWVEVLLEIKDFATKDTSYTPIQIMESISGFGLKEFIKEIFPKTFEFIEKAFSNSFIEREAISVAQEFAYADSWKNIVKKSLKPAQKKPPPRFY